jgi:hypothetical protein
MAKMTIIDERKIITTYVDELNWGDIFNFEGEYFIMSDDAEEVVGVNLENGERRVFAYDEEVLLVNATLTIN